MRDVAGGAARCERWSSDRRERSSSLRDGGPYLPMHEISVFEASANLRMHSRRLRRGSEDGAIRRFWWCGGFGDARSMRFRCRGGFAVVRSARERCCGGSAYGSTRRLLGVGGYADGDAECDEFVERDARWSSETRSATNSSSEPRHFMSGSTKNGCSVAGCSSSPRQHARSLVQSNVSIVGGSPCCGLGNGDES